MRAKGIVSWILVVLMAAGYLLAAAGKLTGVAASMFEGWGYAPWFMMLIGVLELAGAIGLLIPKLTRFAILGLTVIMLGAMYTHLTNDQSAQVVRPMIFLAFLWSIWFLRGRPGAAARTAT